MERQVKKITLPVTKKDVEIYSYITGFEKRTLTEMMLKGGSIDLSTNTVKGDLPLDVLNKANDEAVKMLVRNITIEEINLLPVKDYDFLYAEINKITQDTDFLEDAKI